MILNPEWKYKEVMKNMKEIRKEYILMCQSFDYYHLHDRVVYRTKIKRQVYDYPFNENQKNYIWSKLNKRYTALMKLKEK